LACSLSTPRRQVSLEAPLWRSSGQLRRGVPGEVWNNRKNYAEANERKLMRGRLGGSENGRRAVLSDELKTITMLTVHNTVPEEHAPPYSELYSPHEMVKLTSSPPPVGQHHHFKSLGLSTQGSACISKSHSYFAMQTNGRTSRSLSSYGVSSLQCERVLIPKWARSRLKLL
jgi:hypothetical protein